MADPTRANLPRLSLHVPEPKFRPGDAVDFVGVEVPPAGSAPRPDTAASPRDFTELAYTMVRVLDEENRAVVTISRNITTKDSILTIETNSTHNCLLIE